MTSIVTRLALDTLPATPGQALATSTGGIVVLLLVLLLVIRQLVVVADVARSRRIVAALDVAVAPLLIAFAVIMYERLQEILPLG